MPTNLSFDADQNFWILIISLFVIFVGIAVFWTIRRQRQKKLSLKTTAASKSQELDFTEPLQLHIPGTQNKTAQKSYDAKDAIVADSTRPSTSATVAVVEAPPVITEKQRLNKGLSKTSLFLQQALDRIWGASQGEQFYGDLEEVLLEADVGIDFAEGVKDDLRKSWGVRVPVRAELQKNLFQVLVDKIPQAPIKNILTELPVEPKPRVVMVVGVNGVGKTTTIAKLCHHLQTNGKKVIVGAADTFRAAAVDQLRMWIERVGAEGVFQKEGSDPSAVAFDSIQAAKSRGFDICLIDTAGRLHTKTNLMDELQKMKRVMSKVIPEAPHDIWLVVDGSTGQNALQQAREFHKYLSLTGIIVTKLDGSAKGGVVLAITSELKVPVLLIGVGEAAEDLIPFSGTQYVETILSGIH